MKRTVAENIHYFWALSLTRNAFYTGVNFMSNRQKPSGYRPIFRHLGLAVVFLFICFLLVFIWLRHYTRHGQQIELPDYTGQILETVIKDVRARTFRMVVSDSIHVVGKPGHEILTQNPLPGSLVKERRTIYVTVTKQEPDKISVNRLPTLYGRGYHQIRKVLSDAFEIQSEIAGHKFDTGEPDHILAVIYDGDTIIDRRRKGDDVMIEKGSTLHFVVSQHTGGRFPVPDLLCMTYAEAQFVIQNSGLVIAEVISAGGEGDLSTAYVSSQVPDPEEGMIIQGSVMRLGLSREKPIGCP